MTLTTELRDFINWLDGHRDGGCIPLSHDAQARFIQAVLTRAQEIACSEAFLRGKTVRPTEKSLTRRS
jgi:hypothetical protein